MGDGWKGANKIRTERRIMRRAIFLARIQCGEPRHKAAQTLGLSDRQARRYIHEANYDTTPAS